MSIIRNLLLLLCSVVLAGCTDYSESEIVRSLQSSEDAALVSELLDAKGVKHVLSGKRLHYAFKDEHSVNQAVREAFRDWSGIQVEGQANRERLELIVESMGLRHRYDSEIGILLFGPVDDVLMGRIMSRYSGVDVFRSVTAVESEDQLRQIEALLNDRGIGYKITTEGGGKQISWSIEDRELSNEIFNAVMHMQGRPRPPGESDDA